MKPIELSGETEYRMLVIARQEINDYIAKKQKEYLNTVKNISGETWSRIFEFALNTQKYFNCELSVLIHLVCRKDMQSGDIDCINFDYYPKNKKNKLFRHLEYKRVSEPDNTNQDKFMGWMGRNLTTKDTDREYNGLKIRGSPPFDKSHVYSYKYKEWIYNLNFDDLVSLLNDRLSFENLRIIKTIDIELVLEKEQDTYIIIDKIKN